MSDIFYFENNAHFSSIWQNQHNQWKNTTNVFLNKIYLWLVLPVLILITLQLPYEYFQIT